MLTVADNDKEDSFQALRRAVMEYRGTMKEYCKAVGSFSPGIYVFAHIFIHLKHAVLHVLIAF